MSGSEGCHTATTLGTEEKLQLGGKTRNLQNTGIVLSTQFCTPPHPREPGLQGCSAGGVGMEEHQSSLQDFTLSSAGALAPASAQT